MLSAILMGTALAPRFCTLDVKHRVRILPLMCSNTKTVEIAVA